MFFFFFNDTATTEIYTLSLHDALPICIPTRASPARIRYSRTMSCADGRSSPVGGRRSTTVRAEASETRYVRLDRKSTRLNSSHANISYAVFCLKKKNPHKPMMHTHSID